MRKLRKAQKGAVSKTGYLPDSPDRNNAYNIVPSDLITMDTVPHDVLGIGDNGQVKYMPANSGLHRFTGARSVTEIPMAMIGREILYGLPNRLIMPELQDGGATLDTAPLVNGVPQGYSPYKQVGDKSYYLKQESQLAMASGSGNRSDANYEAWLQQQLAAGITPQQLAQKKYISPDEVQKYQASYKPSYVYTQPQQTPVIPQDHPQTAFQGEPMYYGNNLVGLIQYQDRNSVGQGDGGMMNTGYSNVRFMYVKPNSSEPDNSKGVFEIPNDQWNSSIGTTRHLDDKMLNFINGYGKIAKKQIGGDIWGYDNSNHSDNPYQNQGIKTNIPEGDPINDSYPIYAIKKGKNPGQWDMIKDTHYSPNPELAAGIVAGMGVVNDMLGDVPANKIYNNQIEHGLSDARFSSFSPVNKRGYIDDNTGMTAPDQQTLTQFGNNPATAHFGSLPVAAYGAELPNMVMTPINPNMPSAPPVPTTGTPLATFTNPQGTAAPQQDSGDLGDKLFTYLSHQQGVAGINNIIAAAKGDSSLRKDVLSNMKNNVSSDFFKRYSKMDANNFLNYWANKWQHNEQRANNTPTPYDDAFAAAGQQTGLTPSFLKTVASIESDFTPGSNRNKSTQYKGMMQINKDEASQYGVSDIYDPYQNILAAASMMAKNKSQIQYKAGGEYEMNEHEMNDLISQGYKIKIL